MEQWYREELMGWDASPHPGWVAHEEAAYLQRRLRLTVEQTAKVELVFKRHLGEANLTSPTELAAVRRHVQDEIRSLLTEGQRAQFNLISQREGGGLVGMSPWDELDQLDKLVHLTAEQKAPAFEIFLNARENLMENQAPEQADAVRAIKRSKNDELHALLTPEQRAVLASNQKRKPGGQAAVAERQLARLDAVVHLTAAEKELARKILLEEIAALAKFPGADRAAQKPKLLHDAEVKIYAILTPDQQKLLEAEIHRVKSSVSSHS